MRTKLAQRARKLARRIYASLPWGYRISRFLMEAAQYDPKAFGLAMYALFIQAGVEDMPDVAGKPAAEFREEYPKPSDLGKLTRALQRADRSYGAEFGAFCWKTLLKKYKSLEVVENIMQEFMLEVMTGKKKLQPVTLRSAKTWVITGLKYVGGDLLRKDKRRSGDEPMTTEDDEGEMIDIDLADPGAWSDMEEVLDHTDIQKAMREMDKLNPRLPSYMNLRLKGYSDKDIAEEWGVEPPAVFQFKKTWLPRAQPIIDKYIRQAG